MLLYHKIYLYLILMMIPLLGKSQITDPPFLVYKNDGWVNQQIDSMTLREKVAQLMMITAYPTQSNQAKENLISLIKEHNPGGLLVMQGDPVKTADWINEFQEYAKVPLLIAVDAEWGLTMRIDSTMSYPAAQALGAVQDSMFIYQMGRDIGNQMKQLGMHMNFAPVADVSTNPLNPVINFRSFGEDKYNVAEKAWQLSRGMQDAGIIAVAKHFPGHGDTETDSHHTLPLITHNRERIDSVESYPFRYLAKKGINGIMTAHLNVPALDSTNTPSSLSYPIVTEYLRNEIGFNGFIVTDAINMQGVKTSKGNAETEALIAGNDMIEFVPDLKKAIDEVLAAVNQGRITEEEINEKCRKVLALKRWTGLNTYSPAPTDDLAARLGSKYYEVTNRKLIKESLTVLRNEDVLPVQNLDTMRIASVMIGSASREPFQTMLSRYTSIDHFTIDKNAGEQDWNKLQRALTNYNLVIAGVTGMNRYPSGQYGTTPVQRQAVSDVADFKNSIIIFFGNAYALKHFKNIESSKGVILAYQNTQLTQELAAQLIFGAIGAKGILPVSIDERFLLGTGLSVEPNKSLAYTIPEELGIHSGELHQRIDSIAQLGMDSAAYPGCQILIAKDGQVIFHKCYGYHTYSHEQEVEPDNLYDWASLTKVTGPLPALMKLTDEKKIRLDDPFKRYWPEFKGPDRDNITMREVLAHQARLPAWISYWGMALDENGRLSRSVFKEQPTPKFNIRISDHLYMNEDFIKTIMDTICRVKLLPRKKYVYSGLSFYLFPDIIANLTGETYERYTTNHFYKPLGANTITYNPYSHYPLKDIIPTETDDFFRLEKIQGFVHDEGAAMMGGISGNAGLFGTTNDLAKLFQMFLQKGYYGGRRYLSEEVVNEYITIQFPENENRRGLGFDKPYIDNHKNKLIDAYPAVNASKNSFGHSGFTGTLAWADPDNGLLFIFMSNRVYPTRDNSRIYELNIRTAMHQAIYDCLH